jgi:heme/copper-type cytochrome/quinol oxidase subunit 2
MLANDMNVMIFWVCVAIGAVVYAIIIWSLVAYRRTKEQAASFHKSTAAEIAWTVIPLAIIIAMTIPAAKVLTRLYKVENNEIEGMRSDLIEQDKQQLAMKEIESLRDKPPIKMIDTELKILLLT